MTFATGLMNPALTGRRREVLTLLRESSTGLTITEIAGRLGAHANTIRFHLDALTASGQVESDFAKASGPGRPPLLFRARRGMDPDGPRNYRLLATVLADSLADAPDPARKAIDAGRAWGARLQDPPLPVRLTDDQAVERLVGVMDELGFAAEARAVDDESGVGLRHCPFLDLVPARAAVICPLHLGLMQGVMSSLDTSVTVERLEPFAEPDLCLVHLGTNGGAR
jgi:predicted ArsR family transcriptional regulator